MPIAPLKPAGLRVAIRLDGELLAAVIASRVHREDAVDRDGVPRFCANRATCLRRVAMLIGDLGTKHFRKGAWKNGLTPRQQGIAEGIGATAVARLFPELPLEFSTSPA